MIPRALRPWVKKPFLPKSWIQEYAPMNGGDINPSRNSIFRTRLPKILYRVVMYARNTPMMVDTTVETSPIQRECVRAEK